MNWRSPAVRRAAGGGLGLAAALLLAFAAPAAADGGGGSATGAGGQQLTVSVVSDLDAGGQDVTVVGTGFDAAKGIYLAFCVQPAPGEAPTPCGGGADTSGTTGSSVWISSNPPSYGKDIAVPYGPSGSFRASLHVSAALNPTTDCSQLTCAVVTRADHTRSQDRSQDVAVPVSFHAVKGADGTNYALWIGLPAAAAVLLAGGLWLILRRRRTVSVGTDG